jgi:Dihaem cytochrome c
MKPGYESGSGPGCIVLSWIAAVLVLLTLAGCNKPLPEQNTAAAHLYVNRCGQCHRAYSPRSLTAAMWHIQVEVMETKMQEQGVAPLTGHERDTIMSYLTRNAAH